MELEVHYTKDLSIFRFFKGNRKESKSRTNRIMVSIMKKDCLQDFPIVVDAQNRILDGQNRYWAVRNIQKKGVDIGLYYKYAIVTCEADISLVNCAVTTWNIKDYKDMYISQKNIHYIMFDQFCQKYSISKLTSALAMFCNIRPRKTDGLSGNHAYNDFSINNTNQTSFKDGNFIYPDDDTAIIEKANMLCDLAEVTRSGDAFEPALVLAFNEIIKHPEYDHEKMKKQLAKKVFPPNGYRNAIELTVKLEDIYNYQLMKPIRFGRPK